ncbi:unnamed protein product [Somion occarium]|uniref:Phospholipid/glycerol acyltransferase domain-containing protein n=1 Tax=Somion occarium TaxID=3059160 RepID=A0ABP1DAE7_9APHY
MSNKVDLPYEAAMIFWRTITGLFFREVRPRGAFNIPREGPVILVAGPHHNQFLDLLLALQVYRETGRKVRFIVAASSMKRKFIGFFGRILDSIPVKRAADEATPGTGYVTLSDDDPCLVLGHDTRFLSEFAPKMQIMLPKSLGSASAVVLEVLSDTELRLKKEFGGDGKATSRIRVALKAARAEGKPGLSYRKIPFLDQQEMYHDVYECMKTRGGSHDRPDLLPLKAGVALMALGAMANHPEVKVKIVPVGLSYFHAHRFRSRAVVEFGTAMDVPNVLVEMFKEGGARKRDAVQQLLNEIHNALKTVTVRAPDYDTLMLIQAARRLYKAPGQQLTLGQVVELNKRFLDAYSQFKDEPRVAALREDVVKYNRLLRDLGLRDHQVPRAQKRTWKTLGLLSYRLLLLSVWGVLALPGVVLNAPIFVLASLISRRKAREALAASSVKIAGRDVLATWKILISLGLTPLLYGFYAILATVLVAKAGAPLKWRLWTPFLVIGALPMIAYAALKFGEAGIDVIKSLRPLIIALVPGQQRHLDRAKAMRERLSREVVDVVNEFGPKLYRKFEEWHVASPLASPPPYAGPLGRGKGKARGEAQGVLLSHPMTWLDEKVFGWRNGNSEYASRAITPNESEEEPDYDNLLASAEDRPLDSRESSYADVQRLRITTSASMSDLPSSIVASGDVEITSPIPNNLHMRRGHRIRRHSLSEDVPVIRIARLGRRESFEEGTAEINKEIFLKETKTQHDHQE